MKTLAAIGTFFWFRVVQSARELLPLPTQRQLEFFALE